MQSPAKNVPFMDRGAGVLLPVFSLPSFWGVGGFGAEATRFIAMIRQAGFRYWQNWYQGHSQAQALEYADAPF